jgi:hypothetical protein
MPLPANYTEETLATYLHTTLGGTATTLGWTAEASYAEIVNDALLLYDETVEDITTITGRANLAKLRKLALLASWRVVLAQSAALYDQNADGADLSRSQIHKAASENVARLESECAEWLPLVAGEMKIFSVEHTADPYAWPPGDSAEAEGVA